MVAVGDYVVSRLIEDSGGVVVAEMLDEGMIAYKWDVEVDGDLVRNIGETLYVKRILP